MALPAEVVEIRTGRARGLFAALVLLTFAAEGFAAEPAPDFVRDIRPILATHCFACHGPDANTREAGLRLDQAAAATEPLVSGKTAIVPKHPDRSEFVRRIETADANDVMPPADFPKPLKDSDKKLLRRWIESGAEYAEHWAYRVPRRSEVPVVSQDTWIRHPIDRFVLARLDAVGLPPSGEAKRETLLRRLSLDLLGLPPTLDDLESFLGDTSPDAYERAVDRLLASPHYGEKLAQDWLDLARFGDTSGYQDDNDRPNHPYRDIVIQAFNANLPFDQLTIESLAGDLLPQPTISQKVLSGFNRLHRYNEEGGSDPEEFRVVYAVDRTNTTAATWMGLSFGCAQCHDHKYDPFTQREYYQLLAFFNSLKGEITVSKGPANPPQIVVADPETQRRIEGIASVLAELDPKVRAKDAEASAGFAQWVQQVQAADSAAKKSKSGAIGGVVARTARRAYYGDTKLDGVLSLDKPLRSSGRVCVVKTINSDVEVVHFARNAERGTPGVGFSIAEGPRFFAHVGLPDGNVIHSSPIAAEHGVEYEWHCSYDPASSQVVLELQRDGKPVGKTSHVLTPQQRAAAWKFDTFGISFRGINDADSPIELFLDDIEYTASPDGTVRTQNFDHDPGWLGEGNQSDGHKFGYDPLATTDAPDGLSVAQLAALPADKRTAAQTARLKQHYLREHAPALFEWQNQLASLRKQKETLEQAGPLALVWEEMPTPRPTQILVRGDYQQPGEIVDRNVPAIFPPLPGDVPKDRLSLARWLVDGHHPLTARVAVNRYWKQAFGAGLVRTPDDFGVRGELPTHPELLDWLAVEFQADWDIKRLLRQMVSSATYRQSSDASRTLRERDPDNRLLARGARFRLSAEEIRDAALTSAGLLTRHIGGRSVFPYQPDHFYRDKEDDPNEWKWPVETGSELYRRGLYTFIRRTSPYPSFQTFDVSGRGECTVARARTNTPLQALVTMNDPVFVEAARVLAERVVAEAQPAERIDFLARCVLTRTPTAAEKSVLQRLYQTEIQRFRADRDAAEKIRVQGRALPTAGLDAVEVATWTTLANAVLNLDEAITRE